VRGGRVAMTDRVITPEMAVTLHAEGVQRRELPAWIVFQEEPDYSGKVIARFAVDAPTTPCWWLTHSPTSVRCCRRG